MLSVTGLNHFYYVRDFTDMRCKHSRVLSIIRERLHREPSAGDVFIVMSRNRRIVRMFSFDNRSYSLFEKKFVAGYQFMKVERNGADIVYRIDRKERDLFNRPDGYKTMGVSGEAIEHPSDLTKVPGRIIERRMVRVFSFCTFLF